MSNLITRLNRRLRRQRPDYTPPTQVYVDNKDGSREVLHPTKGWRHVSEKRINLYK